MNNTTERDELIEKLRTQRHHIDDWRTDLAERAADMLEEDALVITKLEASLAEAYVASDWLRSIIEKFGTILANTTKNTQD